MTSAAGPTSLPVIATGDMRRHPDDDWLAEPMRLSPATQRALHGVIRALLPPPPAPRPEGMEERVATQVRIMMQYLPRPAALGLSVLVRALEQSPWLMFHARGRLSTLPAEQACRWLQRMADSSLLPVRMLLLAPRALVLSAYFDQPEVHAALGYDPQPFLQERAARRKLQMAAADAEPEPAQVSREVSS